MNEVVVVDTNVPIVANGREQPVDCVVACQAALLELLRDQQGLALDNRWLIISEYKRQLSPSGQPGIGDRFLKWVLTNWGNPDRCHLVSLTPLGENDFEEFPKTADLKDFDPSDRKFVAVANAHPAKPKILQAVDSKWFGSRAALASAAIKVEFLCPTIVESTNARKARGQAGQPT